MTADYKQRHKLKGNFYLLRHPDREGHSALVDRLRTAGHGVLVDAHKHARALAAVYTASDSDAALEAWMEWRDETLPELWPFVQGTIRNLDLNWREEVCAAANYKVPSLRGSNRGHYTIGAKLYAKEI